MIVEEARWIRRKIEELQPSRIVNYGSSTLKFRTIDQPFISGVFLGYPVLHIDKKEAPGVDLVLDLTSQAFLEKVPAEWVGVGLGVLTSVLEHVYARGQVLANVALIGSPYLIVSVPSVWQYHPDPVDTMYRPTMEELAVAVELHGYTRKDLVTLYDNRGEIVAGLFERVDT